MGSIVKISETRKVQKFGRSTLMVSLPADWVKMVGLAPGDVVRIEAREDGSLIIVPESVEKKAIRTEARIVVKDETPEEILKRAIYALYISGYDRVAVESAGKLLSTHHIAAVRSMARMLIGAEIVEQTVNRIVVGIFVDAEKYNLDNLVLRMFNIIKNMLDFLVASLEDGDVERLREVEELEYELDRVYALTVRHTFVLNRLGGSPYLVEYRTFIKSLEDIGDSIAQLAKELAGDKSILDLVRGVFSDKLKELKELLFYVYDLTYSALTSLDIFTASKATDLSQELGKYLSKIEAEVLASGGRSATEYAKLKLIFNRLTSISIYLSDAAETVLDIVVSKQGPSIVLNKKIVE